MFTKDNNARKLRRDEYRVWAYGQSAVVRSPGGAQRALRTARKWCHAPGIVDHDGNSVKVRYDVGLTPYFVVCG